LGGGGGARGQGIRWRKIPMKVEQGNADGLKVGGGVKKGPEA